MPIYAYRCDSCGVRKDVLQKISDAPLAQCPDCGADSFRKELSAPAFQLKGSGWYVTDFRDQGKKDKAGAPDEAGVADKAGAAAESAGAATAGAATAGAASAGAASDSGSAGKAGTSDAGSVPASTGATAGAVASPAP